MRKLSLYKSAVQATPEQGEQLPLFSNMGHNIGDIVWWNGKYPASGGMVGSSYYGWVRVKENTKYNTTYGELQRVVIFDKGGDRYSMLVRVVDLSSTEPKTATLKLGVEATPEQGEQLPLFNEDTFPTGKFKVGQVVWWNGWYPTTFSKYIHSKGGMEVTIKSDLEESSYGITYYVEPLHTGGSYYILPEDLSYIKPVDNTLYGKEPLSKKIILKRKGKI